jgi:hypothetical protein
MCCLYIAIFCGFDNISMTTCGRQNWSLALRGLNLLQCNKIMKLMDSSDSEVGTSGQTTINSQLCIHYINIVKIRQGRVCLFKHPQCPDLLKKIDKPVTKATYATVVPIGIPLLGPAHFYWSLPRIVRRLRLGSTMTFCNVRQ